MCNDEPSQLGRESYDIGDPFAYMINMEMIDMNVAFRPSVGTILITTDHGRSSFHHASLDGDFDRPRDVGDVPLLISSLSLAHLATQYHRIPGDLESPMSEMSTMGQQPCGGVASCLTGCGIRLRL
jgi:hypothetical protein